MAISISHALYVSPPSPANYITYGYNTLLPFANNFYFTSIECL
jgi:hypothetical protein